MTTLVLGATGKTGARVLDRLDAAGVSTRAGSRHPDLPGAGGDAVRFDWDDDATWPDALTGVDRVYLVPPTFRADPSGPAITFVRRLAEEAPSTGVVLLSARGVDADDAIPLRRIELALLASGLPSAIVRPAWFMQNFTEGVFAADVAAGRLVVPAGQGGSTFVDVDDIADVATALLTSDSLDGGVYELSGPSALTWAEAAAALAVHVGRPVAYQDADPDAWARDLASGGVPADYAGLLSMLFGVIRAGGDASVSDGVQRVLGREPTSFEEWLSSLPAARRAG